MALLRDLAARVEAIESRLTTTPSIETNWPVTIDPANTAAGRIRPVIFFPGSSHPDAALFREALDRALLACSAWLRSHYQCRLWFEWAAASTSAMGEAEWAADLWGGAQRHAAPEAGQLDLVAAYCSGAPGYGSPMLDGRAGLAAINGAVLERLAMTPVAKRRFAPDPALLGLTLEQDRDGAIGLLLHEALHAAGASAVDRDPADGVYEPHPSDPADLMSTAGPQSWPHVTLNAADLAAVMASGFVTAV